MFWRAIACPLLEDCSDASWKRAGNWGWDEESCKQHVAKHLLLSSRHPGITTMEDHSSNSNNYLLSGDEGNFSTCNNRGKHNRTSGVF